MVKNIISTSSTFPKFYILMCKIHKGKIYSTMRSDNVCASCGKLKSNF